MTVIRLATPLAEGARSTPGIRSLIAKAYIQLGNVVGNDPNRRSEAKAAWENALGILEPLNKEFPFVAQYQRLLGITRGRFARYYADDRQWEQAESSFTRSVSEIGELAEAYPWRPGFWNDLGDQYAKMIPRYLATGRTNEAVVRLQAAIAQARRMSLANPRATHFRASLGDHCETLGDIQSDAGSLNEAGAAYSNAVTVYEALKADFPGDEAFTRKLEAIRAKIAALSRPR